MEDAEKGKNVVLVRPSEGDRIRRLIADPAFKSRKTFSKDLAAIHSVKTKIILNGPIYVGMCVLDLSKLFMHDFWYNHLKKYIYGDKNRLLYTDTDSLIIEVETEDIYKDMHEHREDYDFSEYPENSLYYNKGNKMVIGKFKVECKGKAISYIYTHTHIYTNFAVVNKFLKRSKNCS